MSAESTSRQRYSQAFVLLLLGGLLFIMVSSSLVGVSDFENNLILKNLLIEKANWLRLKIGDRVFPNVLIGKDGWMEYTGDGNLNDYQNAIPIPKNGEKILVKRLESFNQYLQGQGITRSVNCNRPKQSQHLSRQTSGTDKNPVRAIKARLYSFPSKYKQPPHNIRPQACITKCET